MIDLRVSPWRVAFCFIFLVATVFGVHEPPEPAGAQTVGSSVVTVRARGRLGSEAMELRINGVVAAAWSGVSSTMTSYSHTVTVPTTVESIRVHSTGGGWPKSLIVDHIVIDGVFFESEAVTTLSSGSWASSTGCSQGYKLSAWLQCSGGWFDYEAAVGVPLAGGTPPPQTVPLVIYDTDVGVDIDDALGLAMLHAYAKQGEVELSAVTISRNSNTAARYVDLLNTFYGRPSIPIGVYRGKTPQDGNDRYTRTVAESGLYPFDLDPTSIPEGYMTMRRVLADAPSQSVVIIQVGFSGNTARLLGSGPDEISPLTGQQLVDEKVRLLAVMGGDNTGGRREFNIVQDLPNAQIVFSQWPEELLQNEARLGDSILYPGDSVFTDFEYVEHHPIKDSYLNEKLPWHEDAGVTYNMRSWDLLSVLSAIESPETYFPVSGPGRVTVDPDGFTSFAETGGLHRTLGMADDLTATEKEAIVARLRELVPESP